MSCNVKTPTGTATHTFGTWDGTTYISYGTIGSAPNFSRSTFNFIFGAAGTTIAPQLLSVASNEPEIYIDDCFVADAALGNLSQISQAQFVGSIQWAPTASCFWVTNNSSWANYTNITACAGTARTITGGVTDASVGLRPAVGVPNIGPGRYEIRAHGSFYKNSVANSACYYRISDGTTGSNPGTVSSNSAESAAPYVSGEFSYSTGSASKTFDIQAFAATAINCAIDAGVDGLELDVYYFPSQAQTVFKANAPAGPTITKLTSGSGTYTTPSGATLLHIRMVGAGGGGAGGNTSGVAGGLGGNTTFGTSLLVANGGNGGKLALANSGGGTASIALPAIGTALTGGTGSAANLVTGGYSVGGIGAATSFGGAGGGASPATAGASGIPNTGSGGGGGSGASGQYSGNGGDAGGLVDAYISSPSASYTYSIGASGTAGTGAFAGGTGGSGYIEITEYYGANAPVLIGSVTSNSSGAERTERLAVTAGCSSGTCAIGSQSGSWVSSVVWNSLGSYTVNLGAGMFSAAPTCLCTNITTGTRGCATSSPTTGSFTVYTTVNGTGLENDPFSVLCMGPR
jgi:hypothetical protein